MKSQIVKITKWVSIAGSILILVSGTFLGALGGYEQYDILGGLLGSVAGLIVALIAVTIFFGTIFIILLVKDDLTAIREQLAYSAKMPPLASSEETASTSKDFEDSSKLESVSTRVPLLASTPYDRLSKILVWLLSAILLFLGGFYLGEVRTMVPSSERQANGEPTARMTYKGDAPDFAVKRDYQIHRELENTTAEMPKSILGQASRREQLKIVMLGGHQLGTTQLASAITKVLSKKGLTDYVTVDQINEAPEQKVFGITMAVEYVKFRTQHRHYVMNDFPRNADLVKSLFMGAVKPDGAILVVSATEGPTPQTREHILLARRVGVPHIVVYIDKADMVDDPERLELVEREVRELLDQYEFPGDKIPVIVGSALKALEGDTDEAGVYSIERLTAAMDEFIPVPERAVDQPFLMPIEDVFSISGRGTLVTGRVERGKIKAGEKVEIVGIRPTAKTSCVGVEMFRKLLDEGVAGDNVGVLLSGTKREEVVRGQVLAKPGSITPHTHFEAEIYWLSKEEGGRHTAFFNGYRPQFYFRSVDMTGSIELPRGVEKVMPGDNTKITVKLIVPIAMEKGLHFAVREGGRTVGAGVIAKVIE